MAEDLPLLGFGLPVSGAWATPALMREVARRAEELGYASLWTFQRLLRPVDAGLEPAHHSVVDAVLPLAFVAGDTERIGLGTATLCAPFTPPVVLAKSLATLDRLAAGRLTVGLGLGWMPEEYDAAGVPMAHRGARMDEYLRCLTALWTQDPVEFSGDFYRVPRSHVAPRPVQVPHPPILLGGSAEPALRRAGRLAQGWIGSSRHDLDEVTRCISSVRAEATRVGRDSAALRMVLRVVVDLVARDPGRSRRPFHGTREQVVADLAGARARGVSEVFVDLNLAPRVGSPEVDPQSAADEARRVLEALAPTAWGAER